MVPFLLVLVLVLDTLHFVWLDRFKVGLTLTRPDFAGRVSKFETILMSL